MWLNGFRFRFLMHTENFSTAYHSLLSRATHFSLPKYDIKLVRILLAFENRKASERNGLGWKNMKDALC